MWFSKAHTWDELKKQKEHFEKENYELRHKIRELESELKIAIKSKELLLESEIEKVKLEHKQELLDLQIQMEKDFHKKTTDYLLDVNKEGNAQTKFVQELAIKMLEKTPKVTQIG